MYTRGWVRYFQRTCTVSRGPWMTPIPHAPAMPRKCEQDWKPSGNMKKIASTPCHVPQPQHRLPVLYGPSSVPTGLKDSESCRCGQTITGEWASVGDWPINSAGWMYTSIRTKKKRGKKEIMHKNAEQLDTKASTPPLRLEDHAGTAEPPAAIAATIRTQTLRSIKGRKTSRMFAFRNKYRLTRLLGLTHDEANDEALDSTKKSQGRTFVTPLTRLQHQATLPRSPLHKRFEFRHSLRYTCLNPRAECWMYLPQSNDVGRLSKPAYFVAWGGPQVVPVLRSNCHVTFRLGDMGLTAAQRTQLAAVVGHDRISGNFCCLESDVFPKLNQNAAHLVRCTRWQAGDSLELLVRQVRKL